MVFKTVWVVVLPVLLLGCGGSHPAMAPGGSSSVDEIVNGDRFGALPAVGMLLFGGSPHCTATLTGPRTVVTAAHCLFEEAVEQLQFCTGRDFWSRKHCRGLVRKVTHPAYAPGTFAHDVGWAELADDVPVDPIPLLREPIDASWLGERVFFVGYGANNGLNGSGSGIRRAGWSTIGALNETRMQSGSNGVNTCRGDSGGPALIKGENWSFSVAGIAICGDTTCQTSSTHVRVDAYWPFLDGTDIETAPLPESPCEGLTEPRCDGTILRYCNHGCFESTVKSTDCSAIMQGGRCGVDGEHGRAACIAK